MARYSNVAFKPEDKEKLEAAAAFKGYTVSELVMELLHKQKHVFCPKCASNQRIGLIEVYEMVDRMCDGVKNKMLNFDKWLDLIIPDHLAYMSPEEYARAKECFTLDAFINDPNVSFGLPKPKPYNPPPDRDWVGQYQVKRSNKG